MPALWKPSSKEQKAQTSPAALLWSQGLPVSAQAEFWAVEIQNQFFISLR